eukprot:6187613-Pleurochrysis_carterae.AAC.11
MTEGWSPIGVRNIGKSKVEAVREVGALRRTLREFRRCTPFWAGKQTHSPLCTDKAKPLRKPRILRTGQELRQQGARRRDRGL